MLNTSSIGIFSWVLLIFAAFSTAKCLDFYDVFYGLFLLEDPTFWFSPPRVSQVILCRWRRQQLCYLHLCFCEHTFCNSQLGALVGPYMSLVGVLGRTLFQLCTSSVATSLLQWFGTCIIIFPDVKTSRNTPINKRLSRRALHRFILNVAGIVIDSKLQAVFVISYPFFVSIAALLKYYGRSWRR